MVFWEEKPVNRLKVAIYKYLARLLRMFFGQTMFVQVFQGTKMSKTNSIVDFLEAGIRAESLRQKAIANNIANLETSGYRRIDVKFEELLARALSSSGPVDLSELEPQIHQPLQTPVNPNDNDVSLESEVGQMVKNSLRYKAYIRILNKKYRQMELAMEIK